MARSNLSELPAGRVSNLAEEAALVLTVIMVVLWSIRLILDSWILPRLCAHFYRDMTERQRRGFVNHIVAGATKLTTLAIGVFPMLRVVFGSANFMTPVHQSSSLVMGDLLLVASQMIIGMYIFELLYRTEISPVTVCHHLGTVILGQTAVVLSLHMPDEPDASIEFAMCIVWGAFDTIAELIPHFAIVLYRWDTQAHKLISRVCLISSLVSLLGTIAETIVIFYLLASVWDVWAVGFKAATPVLHCIFSAAQLWGSWKLFEMYRSHRNKARRDPGRPTESDSSQSIVTMEPDLEKQRLSSVGTQTA